jgi:hypothetical protein
VAKKPTILIQTLLDGLKNLTTTKRWKISEFFYRDMVEVASRHNEALVQLTQVTNANAELLEKVIAHVGYVPEVLENVNDKKDKLSDSAAEKEATGEGEA